MLTAGSIVLFIWLNIYEMSSLLFQCHLFFFPIRSEDDYSEEEEEEEDDEEEEEYDGEIPQPELEPRSRRCLVGDAGVCVIPGGNSSEEEDEEDEEEDDEDGEHDMCGEDSDSDGPVLYKDEDSDEDEEDEPPPSKHLKHLCFEFQDFFLKPYCTFSLLHTSPHFSAWLSSRCSGQPGQKEGHTGSEAKQPSICPRQGQVYPGEEQPR